MTRCGWLIAAATEATVDVQEDASVETAEMQQARHQLPSAVSGRLHAPDVASAWLLDCTIVLILGL